jgi:tetratricopeptide (TPR) repeat protein
MRSKWLAVMLAAVLTAQQPKEYPAAPLVEKNDPLRAPLLLLREGKTAEARKLLANHPTSTEAQYQIARSYLADFYGGKDPQQRRLALSLAMEALNSTLKRNANHIPAMRAKALIHARAELLYYDPNLSYELGAKVAKLEPHNHGFLLNLSEWLSGEVRFTQESGHRVPHDPLLGLDRSIAMLEQVIDNTIPLSNEETAALFMLGNTLSRRGNFRDAIPYYKRAAERNITADQKAEIFREIGAAYYRNADFVEAARMFYEAQQWRKSTVDQWLLRIALDQIKGPVPPLPKDSLFEMEEPKVDPANPPMLAFQDVAQEKGLLRLNGNGTCGWGDIDGDGDQDLIVSGSGTFVTAYRNDGGRFSDFTKEVGLSGVPSGYSLNLIDYDNDGALDLFISMNGWNGPMKDQLFHNERGKFVDVSKQSGLDDPGSGFVSLWGDLDNDGWLDVVIANGVLKEGSVPQIYRNNKNGTFTNVTLAAGLNEPASFGAIGLALGDYDKDGRLDIFINGLNDGPNRLYHNDGNWRFTDVTRKAGVAQAPHNGFVAFFLDYNNDGWPDLLTTSLAPWDIVAEALKQRPKGLHPDASRLFRNNGNGTFTDVTMEAKLYYPMGTMGAGVADLDNDGHVDLYFGTGDPQITRLEPNRFFRNNGDGTFSDFTRYVGFQRPGNKGHGVGFIDLDEDGDLEVFAQLGGHYPGDYAYNAFYMNQKANRNHWLEVDLRGAKSNRSGIGTQLTVKAGGLVVYREVKGSEGFGATSPYRQHFGLGKVATIDSLEIRWPSGIRQMFTAIDADRIIAVAEDEKEWKRVK